MRLPSAEEARYLRELSMGMWPASDIHRPMLKSLLGAGWVYKARFGHAETWIALSSDGAVALERFDGKEV